MGTTSQLIVLAGLLCAMLTFGASSADSESFTGPTSDPLSNYSKVTCDFSENSCGWENVGGDNFPLRWRRHRSGYMHLDLGGAGERKGRLASPWLPPLTNSTCTLAFRYYIQKLKPKNCRLSLYRQSAGGGERQLWTTRRGTGWSSFSRHIYQDVLCTTGPFRIVFEGWKSCDWAAFNEIDVKSVRLTVHSSHVTLPPEPVPSESEMFTIDHNYTGTMPTVVPDTTGTASTKPSSNAGLTSEPANKGGTTEPQVRREDKDTDQSDLSYGALAGIIIAIIIVIAVVIVIVVVVVVVRPRRRRRAKAYTDKHAANRNLSPAVTNSAYMLDTEQIAGTSTTSAPGDNYEQVDLPPPYEALPHTRDDNPHHHDDVSKASPPSHPPSPVSPNSHSYVNAASPPDAKNSNCANTSLQRGAVAAPASGFEDSYNRINRAPRAAVSDDTYDHTNVPAPPSVFNDDDDSYNRLHRGSAAVSVGGRHEDKYDHANNIQQQQQQLFSDDYAEPQTELPAKSVQRPSASSLNASAAVPAPTATAGYEIVDDVGQKRMTSPVDDDAYNRLDVTGEKRGEGKVGENVYDHAKDDNYDSLREENRRRRQQRELAEDDYSHI